jgi:hypothetical protein
MKINAGLSLLAMFTDGNAGKWKNEGMKLILGKVQ